jgi:glutaredoxin-like YruB-family protein
MKNVTIYSTPTCHYCKEAKAFMQARGVPFTEHNVASDLERRKEMIDKTGQMGVPVIDVDGQLMVGYSEEELATALGVK